MQSRAAYPAGLHPICALVLVLVIATFPACGGSGGGGGGGSGPAANAPPLAQASADPSVGQAPLVVSFDASASADPDGSIASYAWDFGDGTTGNGAATTHTYTAAGTYSVTLVVMDDAGATDTWTTTIRVQQAQGVPTGPAGGTFAEQAATLYTGPDATQSGVDTGAMQAYRLAVVRGRVLDRTGSPLSGVAIAVLGHPEFGQTLTREDGTFEFAVNGGGWLAVNYAKEGYLTAQRRVLVPWNNVASVPDVRLVPLDTQGTPVNLAGPGMKVARGSRVSDASGERQATLLVPQGTGARAVGSDGTERRLSTLTIRATEFTVGQGGPESMPGPLPPTSMYTYAVEYTADEALDSRRVEFDRPLIHYNEDFIGFPVGTAVPTAYYDREKGAWIPSENGLVVEVLGEENGRAQLDTDGDGQPDSQDALDALGVTDEELRKVAELYEPGQRLWRVRIPHFTPWDCNWPFGPPGDARPPPRPGFGPGSPDKPCRRKGSVLVCEDQVLGEELPVAGTPFRLVYRSSRAPGYERGVLRFALSDAAFPDSLASVKISVSGFGEWVYEEPPTGEIEVSIPADPFGRPWRTGLPPLSGFIRYCYPPVYYPVPADFENAFGRAGVGRPDVGVSVEREGAEICLNRPWTAPAQVVDAPAEAYGLAGWSLDVHHVFDPATGNVFLGSGERQQSEHRFLLASVEGAPCSLLGPREAPPPWVMAPDGKFYSFWNTSWGTPASSHMARLAVWSPEGGPGAVVEELGDHPLGPDPTDPNDTYFLPGYVAVGPLFTAALPSSPAGTGYQTLSEYGLYFVNMESDDPNNPSDLDFGYWNIAYLGPDGVRVIAGLGGAGFGGDGGPALDAQFSFPHALAVAPDGTVYVADTFNHRIRAIGPDGTIHTVAGTGEEGSERDEGPATEAQLDEPSDLALGPDGTLYVLEGPDSAMRIRAIGPDGVIRLAAGGGTEAPSSGLMATDVHLQGVRAMTVGPRGSLYLIAEVPGSKRQVLLKLEGARVEVLAGQGEAPFDPEKDLLFGDEVYIDPDEGTPVMTDVEVRPDGEVFVFLQSLDDGTCDVRRAPAGPLPAEGGRYYVVSEDNTQIWVFDTRGTHLATLDAPTRAVLYAFEYDEQGRLVGVTDRNGGTTRIERNTAGEPIAIVSPAGVRTQLSVGPDGYIEAVTSPDGASWRFAYGAGDGLMTSATDPNGNIHTYRYDENGRLTWAGLPTGDGTVLDRREVDSGWEVGVTSPEGHETVYRSEAAGDTGAIRLTREFPGGSRTETVVSAGGRLRDTTLQDGTAVRQVKALDPLWPLPGAVATYPALEEIRTPAGLTFRVERIRWGDLEGGFTQSVAVDGVTYSAAYDPQARELTVREPGGRRKILRLDEKGRPIYVQLGGMAPLAAQYDAASGGIAQLSADGGADGVRIVTFEHDERGYLSAVVDPGARRLSFERDASGRIVSEILPGGGTLRFERDSNGNVTKLTLPNGDVHAVAYDSLNRPVSYTPPWGLSTTFAYDAEDNLTALERPDGTGVRIEYDQGRPAKAEVDMGADGSWAVSLERDATGRIDGYTTSDGVTLAWTWDGFLLTREAWSGPVAGQVGITWDGRFRPSEIAVGSAGTVRYTYNPDGTIAGTDRLQITWDTDTAWITGIDLGQVRTRIGRNAFGEVMTAQSMVGQRVLYGAAYQRDALGRIASVTETIGGTTTQYTYTYDAAGRLTGVVRNGTPWVTYAYDENGNRTRVIDDRGDLTARYDAGDRLTAQGSVTYENGSWGQRIARKDASGTTRYVHDALGRLRRVTLPDGTEIRYLIDGLGRRVAKLRGGSLVQGFLYRGLRPVAEIGPDGQVKSYFVYGSRTNAPDYMVVLGGGEERIYRFLHDQRGSVRLVVDADTGEIAQQIDYDPYGRVLSDTRPGFQPFGFAGGVYDPDTGLVHMGLRDYDPETGRFLTPDPYLFGSGALNLYAYAGGDPVNRIDLWAAKDVLGHVADVAAGIGDAALSFVAGTLTFGLWEDPGGDIRRFLGFDKVVDPCSDAYKWSRFGAEATLTAVGVVGTPGDINLVRKFGRTSVSQAFSKAAGMPGWKQSASLVLGFGSGAAQAVSQASRLAEGL